MFGQPSESTPATNTRRRAADRPTRAGSSSSVKSYRLDATVVRRDEADSASYVRLHRDSDPLRHTNLSPTADATLLVPYPSNPAPLDSVLSALLFQMKQLSSVLASRDAAQSVAITAVSNCLNRLESSRSDRSDREFANLQSVPLPFPPVRHSRRRISRVETRSRPHAPRRCGPRPGGILRTTAGAVCESFEKVGMGPS